MTVVRRPALHGAVLAAAIAGLAAGAALAQPVKGPVRRAGLWSLTLNGGPGGALHMQMQSCVDPARDRSAAAVFTSGREQANCDTVQISPGPGGGYAFHMVCRPPGAGMTMDTHGTASGDFQSAYTVKTTTRMDPPPLPSMAESAMTMTAKYLGACPAGMKPGDAKVNGRMMHSG